MPMTVKVGLAKKVGQRDFGSLGASCDIELELDGSLLFHDLDGLQQKVRVAYIACRQAVNDELASQTGSAVAGSDPDSNGSPTTSGNGYDHGHPNGSANGRNSGPAPATNGSPNGSPNGARPHTGAGGRKATQSQVRALHAIATRQQFALTDLLRDRFGLYRGEDLSLRQASQLIDELNATPAGSRA